MARGRPPFAEAERCEAAARAPEPPLLEPRRLR